MTGDGTADPAADVLVIVPHYPPAYKAGGPARTIEAMVSSSSHPSRVHVLTSDRDHGCSQPMAVVRNLWHSRQGCQVRYVSSNSFTAYVRALWSSRRVRPRYIYLNSLFDVRFSVIPAVLARLGFWGSTRVVLAPRGELDPGALSLSGGKKRVFLRVMRMLRIYAGSMWHASSSLERDQIRASGLGEGPVLVKENETLLPAKAESCARTSPVHHLLYVGRISRKKQLHLLLAALAYVEADFSLTVVGESDDPGYKEELLVLAAPYADRVTWAGAVSREEIFDHYRRASMALFPTAGENFGHVIAEALAMGCPVMVMDVTPWTRTLRAGGGVVVPNDGVQEWRRAIEKELGEDPTDPLRYAKVERAYDQWRAAASSQSFLDYLVEGNALSSLEKA